MCYWNPRTHETRELQGGYHVTNTCRQEADPSKSSLIGATNTQGPLIPGGALIYQAARGNTCGVVPLPNLNNTEPAYIQEISSRYTSVDLKTQATHMLRVRFPLSGLETPAFKSGPLWVSSKSSSYSFWITGSLNTTGIVFYMVRTEWPQSQV